MKYGAQNNKPEQPMKQLEQGQLIRCQSLSGVHTLKHPVRDWKVISSLLIFRHNGKQHIAAINGKPLKGIKRVRAVEQDLPPEERPKQPRSRTYNYQPHNGYRANKRKS